METIHYCCSPKTWAPSYDDSKNTTQMLNDVKKEESWELVNISVHHTQKAMVHGCVKHGVDSRTAQRKLLLSERIKKGGNMTEVCQRAA